MDLKTKLYRYQRRVLRAALRKRNFALFLDMRTGKTLITLAILVKLFRREKIHRILVVCPKSVVGVWEHQIQEHVALTYTIRTNPKAIISRPWRSRNYATAQHALRFLIINYEQSWRREKDLRKIPWDVVICDEGHRLSKHSSKQSKALWRIGKEAKHRYELTGTPTRKNEIDLFAQFRFLDDTIFGTRWGDFTQYYCRPAGYMGYQWKLRPGAKGRFYRKVKPHQYKLSLREAMPELPPEQDFTIDCEFTGYAARLYEEMEQNYYLEFGGFEFASDLAITNILRLQQLTGGFLDNGEQIIEVEQNKLTMMMDWISDYPSDRPLVIFARFTEEILAIARAVKKACRSYGILDGKTKNKTIWKQFQYEKKFDTMILQIATGSLGIELSRADTAIFFSRTHSYVDYSQARARLLGPNQKSSVQFIHMIGKKSIDIDFDMSLNKKRETSDDVHEHLKRRVKKMARATTKKTTKTTGRKKPTPPPMEKPDFGVAELAEALGVGPAVARQKLRAAGIEKTGRTYDFKNARGVQSLAKQLKSSSGDDKKPAAKGRAKTGAKTTTRGRRASGRAKKTT